MAASATSSSAVGGKSFINRELHGASFLALEHAAHMILVVVIPGLILSALTMLFNMWFGLGSVSPAFNIAYFGGSWITALGAIGLCAALVTLVPLLLVLGSRTRAEWQKRPAFAGRLAYKLPVYGALAVITMVVIGFKIQMLSILLATLAFIGVPSAPYAAMYGGVFLPAFLGLVVFGAAWWYVFKLVKGTDYGRLFSIGTTLLGAVMAIALFITSIVSLHGSDMNSSTTMPTDPGVIYEDPYGVYEDLKKSYR